MILFRCLFCFLLVFARIVVAAQSEKVNPFLGSSGDHGQISPGASAPFSMMDICPQTYPNGHTGYEYKAKTVLGFTHNRFEGVGCQGSGGNILITPFLEHERALIKKTESAHPGYYRIQFKNGITTAIAVSGKSGVEQFHFPAGVHGFSINLAHTLANPFIAEEHQIEGSGITGWIQSGTTCGMGVYKLYYCLQFDQTGILNDSTDHIVKAIIKSKEVTIRIVFSSVSTEAAETAIIHESVNETRRKATTAWNNILGHIKVEGDLAEENLFYSELYRVLQSPYIVSEPGEKTRYSGWSIWDNYKTQLPLLSIAYPNEYGDIISSLTNLYRTGKKNWATDHEPSNTVRTEHSMVVLLDAYSKGYQIDFRPILDSLIKEVNALAYSYPDKALESCYDAWALSQILKTVGQDSLSKIYGLKAAKWKKYWNDDFRDLSKPDIDDLPARGMYQGTIWQYRWMVPFDTRGLIEACGGDKAYINQLDSFFNGDFYNAANEPDIQVPYMYNASSEPWKSQKIIHKYAHDTVVQYYYNDNSRGIDPFIGRIFNNRPDAYVRTMDDDGGAMSAWYCLAAIGLSPACPGHPIWWLHVPLFKSVTLNKLHISVRNFREGNCYIQSLSLNGHPLDRTWLTQKEIVAGGSLIITASPKPNKQLGLNNGWISKIP